MAHHELVDRGSFELMNLNLKDHKSRPRNTRSHDVVEAERSHFQHWRLEESIANLCIAHAQEPLTNGDVDILCNAGSVSIIFEITVCSPKDIATPLRLAVVRLLEYRYLYRDSLNATVKLCIVSDRRPRDGYEWLIGYFGYVGIGLIWKNDDDDKLACDEFTKKLLGEILPRIKTWEPHAILWK